MPDKRRSHGSPVAESRIYLRPDEKMALWKRYGSYLPAMHREVMHLWMDERLYQPDIALRLGFVSDRPNSNRGKYHPTQSLLNEAGLLMYGMKLMDEARSGINLFPVGDGVSVVDAD